MRFSRNFDCARIFFDRVFLLSFFIELKALVSYFSSIYSLYRLFSIVDMEIASKESGKMTKSADSAVFLKLQSNFSRHGWQITYTKYILSKSILK